MRGADLRKSCEVIRAGAIRISVSLDCLLALIVPFCCPFIGISERNSQFGSQPIGPFGVVTAGIIIWPTTLHACKTARDNYLRLAVESALTAFNPLNADSTLPLWILQKRRSK